MFATKCDVGHVPQCHKVFWITKWGSVSAPGIFFLPFPTRACFCPHLTKQSGVPSRRV